MDSELETFQGLHATGTHEHTLCGFAPEAFESGDTPEPVVFATTGELVTCPTCRAQIDHVRQNFKGYRYRPATIYPKEA